MSENFLTINNLTVIFGYGSVYALIATAMTVLFISGSFDLSIGTHLAFLGVFLGMLLGNNIPTYLAIVITILLSIFNGFIIGALVIKLKVDCFIVTLGSLLIFLGAAYLIGYGSSVAVTTYTGSFGNFPESFTRIASGKFFNIEYINFYMVLIVGLMHILLRNNIFFRQNYYIGGNRPAARLAGVKVNVIMIFNFVLVSLMVGIATILRASRVGSTSQSDGGQSLSLFIIAAVILGGASLKGGVGSIIGSILGVFLLVIINNGLVVLNLSPFYTDIIIGFILLISVLLDEYKERLFIEKRFK
ncbi:MAG: ABC transporter permease [Actinobacteria bacterium]|nr:ABC transporter permease [Actinomycetota bacterium]